MRIAHQRVDQPGPGGLVVPDDRRFPPVVVVVPGAVRGDHLDGAGHLAADPTDRGDQLVTVSWVATASSSTVESNARRVFPDRTPVSTTTRLTTSKIRIG